MMHVRPYVRRGLGQEVPGTVLPEPAIYQAIDPGCGEITGSGYRPCKVYTYSQLFGLFTKPTTVYARDVKRNVRFYPVPADVLKEKGLCGTLHGIFERNGIEIPWYNGTTRIEPGVYFPSKTWAQMVAESATLRAGGGTKFAECAASTAPFTQYQPRFGGQPPTNFTVTDAADGTMCDEGGGGTIVGSWSFGVPRQYYGNAIVMNTAAAWVEGYSRGKRWLIYCNTSEDTVEVMDPQWGHRYRTRAYDVSRMGTPGEGPKRVITETPIVEATLPDASGWTGFTPTSVRASMAQGKWPPAGFTTFRWVDTREPVDPFGLVTKPPDGGPKLAGVLAVGIAATVIGLIAWAAGKKPAQGAAP